VGLSPKELYLQMGISWRLYSKVEILESGCYLFVLGIAELFHYYRMERAEPLLKESIKDFRFGR
jgi:hypothetical protein